MKASSNNIPLIIGALLAAAGLPVFNELYKLTDNTALTIAITIVYEIIVIVLSFLSKVGKKVEGRWVDRFANWIDLTLQGVFSGYRRRYLEYLVYQHRVFDVKGLSTQGPFNLELEKVYVQLIVDPTAPHATSSNPVSTLPDELRSGSHSIWEYITDKNAQKNNYAVLGAPGCGKTTLLKHMALALSSAKQRRKVGAPYLLP